MKDSLKSAKALLTPNENFTENMSNNKPTKTMKLYLKLQVDFFPDDMHINSRWKHNFLDGRKKFLYENSSKNATKSMENTAKPLH